MTNNLNIKNCINKVEKKLFIIFSIFSIIYFINFVSAFGVTSPYWDVNPLVLSPGDKTNVQMELQNMVGETNMTVDGKIVSGSEIATITDEDTKYFVPFGRKDVKVNIEISIPENATIGSNYSVGASFTTINTQETGSFGLGSSIEKYFPVYIREKQLPPEAEIVNEGTANVGEGIDNVTKGVSKNTIIIIALILIALIILIIVFYMLKKKE